MKHFFLIVLGMFALSAFSQTPLTGNYIVGGGGPDEDYATLSEAILDLQINGVGEGGCNPHRICPGIL